MRKIIFKYDENEIAFETENTTCADLINALVIICNELKQNEVEEILIRKSVDTGLDCDDFRSYIKRSLEAKNIRSVEVFEL